MIRALLLALLFSASAAAQPLIHEVVVPAPVERVWEAFTTARGQEAWMVARSEVDLRVGGAMRTHYDPNGQLGDAKSIENTILAYDPQRMFAIKVAKHPDTFPFPNAVRQMWTVVYFEPITPVSTRVRSVGLGFGDDEESQKMRAFFDRGNAYTMQRLVQYFGGAPAPR